MDGSDLAEVGIKAWMIQKTAGKALDNIGDALGLLTLPIVNEVGKLVMEYLKRNGHTVNDLHPRYREFFPMLEASKFETDPTLHGMWKNLMASSLTSDNEMLYNYTEICKQLTRPLAQILLLQEEFDHLRPVESRSATDQQAVQLEDDFRNEKCSWIVREDVVVALEYLTKLGVVATDVIGLEGLFDAGLIDEEGQRRANEQPVTFYVHRISNIGKSFLARANGERV